MPEYFHTVGAQEHGMRLDALLATLDGLASRSEAVRLIEAGEVSLNNNPLTEKKYLVAEGEELSYQIDVKQPIMLQGEDIELDIRYEDDDLIVLSKQADLVVHPAGSYFSGTLVNALIAHCGYDNLALLQGDDRPGIVHRLDKDTTGLMLAAKRQAAGLTLQEGIRAKEVKRHYLALVHGIIAPDTGLIDAPLTRGTFERQKIVVGQGPRARESITSFTVLERFDAGTHDDGYTLIECELHTGRTHQIRAHAEYIGHACVGDPVYGAQNRPKAQRGLNRQFLHSWHLSFQHPSTKETCEFFDILPADLAQVLDELEPLSRGRTAASNRVFEVLSNSLEKPSEKK
ncbi:MAG: RluA family pseudouridine synthase [Coriobacteriales bacterium]|jgi:23S rRNA pseudouridine1911/1915/1917 synthase|nr:RluA family pseudouridine synthase [Coriobacteriales bacterium]